jgi:hypothetical protein
MPPKCLRRWTTPVFTKSACPAQKISRFDKCLNFKACPWDSPSHAPRNLFACLLDFATSV